MISRLGLISTLGKMDNIKFISDDIIIFNKNQQDHLQTIDKLFKKLNELKETSRIIANQPQTNFNII